MRVLVTVKATPEVSKRYGETVCVAGIRVDTDPHELVRLFPVRFRDLPQDQQFSKFAYMDLRATRHPAHKDRRRESWRPDPGSIVLGAAIPAGGHWAERRQIVEPLVGPTMCELHRGRRGGGSGPSLGVVRPRKILGINVEEGGWNEGQKNLLAQDNLLTGPSKELERPPFKFSYHYLCEDEACGGHTQSIADWELTEYWRRVRHSADPVEQVKGRWLEQICGPDREPLFFVGDIAAHPGSFMVLGVFWPRQRPNAGQLTLDIAA